nr:unnamed protein product [Spirometra erinaceieuropaei]
MNQSVSHTRCLPIKHRLPLGSETSFDLTPSEPQYFLFTFPEDVDSVYVKTTSPDNLCMTVSVQHAKCPVADLIGNVKYSGIYQTVSTLGGITVTRSHFASQFFVVLVLKPNDVECNGPAKILPVNRGADVRSKVVNLSISHTLAGRHYYLPVLGAVGLFLLFYIAAGIIILIYHTYDKSFRFRLASPRSPSRTSPRRVRHSPVGPHLPSYYSRSSSMHPDPEAGESQEVQIVSTGAGRPRPRRQPAASAQAVLPTTQSTSVPRSNSITGAHSFSRQRLPRSLFSSSSSEGEEAEGGMMQVVEEDRRGESRTIHLTALKRPRSPRNSSPPPPPTCCAPCHPSFGNVVSGAHRRCRVLFVSDLSRKRYSTLNRKYLLYFWYLIIISIFYGLPVAQLVMTYQRVNLANMCTVDDGDDDDDDDEEEEEEDDDDHEADLPV